MWYLFSLSLSQLIRLPSCLPLSLSVSFQKAVFRLLTLARPPVIPSVKTPRPIFFIYPSACIYSIKRHFEGKNISHVMAQAVSVDCALPFVDGDSEWVFLPSACLSVAPDRSALQRRIKTLSRCQVSDMREVENEDYRGSRWLRRQPHLVSEPGFTSERKSTSC